MSFLTRPTMTELTAGASWYEGQYGSIGLEPKCSVRDQVRENISDHKWGILSGVLVIGVSAAIIAIALPIIFSAPACPFLLFFAALIGGNLSFFSVIFSIGIVFNLIFDRPDALGISVDSRLVELIGKEQIKKASIYRKEQTLPTNGGFGLAINSFKFQYTNGSRIWSEKLIIREIRPWELKVESTCSSSSEIACGEDLDEFMKYEGRACIKAPYTDSHVAKVVEKARESHRKHEALKERIQRLLNGEEVPSLRGEGTVRLVGSM